MKLLLFSLYKDEEDKDAFYVASFGVKLIKHGLSSKILTQLFWSVKIFNPANSVDSSWVRYI